LCSARFTAPRLIASKSNPVLSTVKYPINTRLIGDYITTLTKSDDDLKQVAHRSQNEVGTTHASASQSSEKLSEIRFAAKPTHSIAAQATATTS
jgi:hypothetical protein